MSRPKGSTKTPGYCHNKRRDVGYATIAGKQITFEGRFGSKESRAHYDRVIGEWLSAGRVLPTRERRCETIWRVLVG